MNQSTKPHPDETLDTIDDIQVIQKKQGHRFTTDSILLAKLSNPKKHGKVLELGTGCGIVSLLLAKRIPSLDITAVEIQKEMADIAERNVVLNNLDSRMTIINSDLKKLPGLFPSAHFDHIITNPPYRSANSGLSSPQKGRAMASQEISVTLDDIMKVSQYLLKVRGRISLIYSAGRLTDLFSMMQKYRIEPKVMQCIQTGREGRVPLSWIEGVREGRPGMKVHVHQIPAFARMTFDL